MSMVINTNTASLIAQAAQSRTQGELETAMERLSTGKGINSASDDAAGMAMSSRMESQIKGLAMATRNAGDAQSLVDATEGAHDEITNILHRMRELSVQAANSTNVASDVTNLQTEMDQLLAEIDRIAGQTSWNGMNLMDGSFSSKSFQIGPEAGQKVSVDVKDTSSSQIGSYRFEAEGALRLDNNGTTTGPFTADTYTFSGPKGLATVAGTATQSAKQFAAAVNAKTNETGVSASAVTKAMLNVGATIGGIADAAVVTGTVTMSFKLNGTLVDGVSITSSDLTDLRDKINAQTAVTGVVAQLGSSTAKDSLILTDADGDNIDIDDFETDDDNAVIQVATLESNGSTLAAGGKTDSAPTEALATAKYGMVTVLEDGSGGTAAHDRVVIGGATILSATGAFTVTGGAAMDNTDDQAAAGHIKTTSASGILTAVSGADITTISGAESAITSIDGAIDMITSRRADLGAISNRLDYTINNLTSSKVNMEASKSRIADADFAVETSNLTKAQILSQAATAMLAQANASKQSVLSLLQG